MVRSTKSKNNRPPLAGADRRYFKANPKAGFRIRLWKPEDARCGTRTFDGIDLVGTTVLVFRCGARIPAPPSGAIEKQQTVRAFETFAREAIMYWPEVAQDWP